LEGDQAIPSFSQYNNAIVILGLLLQACHFTVSRETSSHMAGLTVYLSHFPAQRKKAWLDYYELMQTLIMKSL
jgi:hypothetical protein